MGSSCSRSFYQCFILSPAVQYCTLERSEGEHPFFFYSVLFIDVFIFLIYFNTNKFAESGFGFGVHSIVSSAQTF